MSDLLIVVDRNNADLNSLSDISDAVADAGASVISVDEERWVIGAAAPAHVSSTIREMEGVSYVRCVFNYLSRPAVPSRVAA